MLKSCLKESLRYNAKLPINNCNLKAKSSLLYNLKTDNIKKRNKEITKSCIRTWKITENNYLFWSFFIIISSLSLFLAEVDPKTYQPLFLSFGYKKSSLGKGNLNMSLTLNFANEVANLQLKKKSGQSQELCNENMHN